jgi:hypothetical protein
VKPCSSFAVRAHRPFSSREMVSWHLTEWHDEDDLPSEVETGFISSGLEPSLSSKSGRQ